MDKKKILPYTTKEEFYLEYLRHCKAHRAPPDQIAKRTVFFEQLHSLRDTVALAGAKGGFHTCEICNSANALLTGEKILRMHQASCTTLMPIPP